MVIAVDFDGVLCDDEFPEIGRARMKEIELVKKCQRLGIKIILWTCRVGDRLEDAIAFCREHGLRFDAINDNLDENKAEYGTNPRKVYADFYWDDRSMFGNPNKFVMEIVALGKGELII